MEWLWTENIIAVCKIDGGATFAMCTHTILCAKLVRLITHKQVVHFVWSIYECYSPWWALLIYQDRFVKGVPQTVPCLVYNSRQLLHTAQLITQSKHVVYLSQSEILVGGTYQIILSKNIHAKICVVVLHWHAVHGWLTTLFGLYHHLLAYPPSTTMTRGKALSRPLLGDCMDVLCPYNNENHVLYQPEMLNDQVSTFHTSKHWWGLASGSWETIYGQKESHFEWWWHCCEFVYHTSALQSQLISLLCSFSLARLIIHQMFIWMSFVTCWRMRAG